MNDLGKNLQWILEDVANGDPEMMDSNDVEIFGETEDGADCSCDIEITELCGQAAKRIEDQSKELESKNKVITKAEKAIDGLIGLLVKFGDVLGGQYRHEVNNLLDKINDK